MKRRLCTSSLLCLILLIISCGWLVMKNRPLPLEQIVYIGDYVFSVEEAIGDQHNVRVRYSLKRADGKKIEPTAEFDSLHSSDGFRSLGGSLQYSLSEDGKTIWIEEEQSSAQKYSSQSIFTVTLENLRFEENINLETIEGTWAASFRIQVDEAFKELIQHDLKISFPKDEAYFCKLTSIQLSPLGVHMEMKLPDNNIDRLADNFKASLVMKNGSVIELGLHHSIRGNGRNNLFDASGETIFDEPVKLDEVHAINVCGQEILFSSVQYCN